MKTRLFTVFVLVVSMAAFVLSKAYPELVLGGVEGLVPVPGVAWLKAAQSQWAAPVALASAPDRARVSAALSSAPLMFIENVGQFPASPGGTGDQRARFQVRGGNATLYLAEDALWFTVLERPQVDVSQGQTLAMPERFSTPHGDPPCQGVSLKLSFVGADPHPRLEPFTRLDTRVSYFVGSDLTKWRADVPVWGGVRYVDLYPGVDLEVTGDGGRWAWRLACKSNCQFDLQKVVLRVDGAEALTLDGDVLRLTTPLGDYTLPLLQVVGAADANLANPTVTGDQVAWPFASAAPNPQLVLSPVEGSAIANPQPVLSPVEVSDASDLLYSTFLGGGGEDRGYAIAVDGTGSAYVTGYTMSSDFPTTAGAFDTSYNNGGNRDAFVVKVNADGTGLDYATFLGGSDWDWGYAIAVDGAGSAYVTGWTESYDFPTTAGAYDVNYNGGPCDTFVVKLNAGGTGLDYATFLGGSGPDYGYGIGVDEVGNAYVAGYVRSDSRDFPTTAGAFDTILNGDYDAFMVKMNAAGTELAYATFLGGNREEYSQAIAVDGAGNAYVTGYTTSTDFPTTAGALSTSHSSHNDAFVVKMNATGTGLAYATLLGGSGGDLGLAIAVDGAGNAYVTGSTTSSDFPTTPGAFDDSYSGGDAFVVKMNADGTGWVYATLLGGSSHEYGSGIAVDGVGSAYVTGWTGSSDFPTTAEAFDPSCGTDGNCNFDGQNRYDDAFVVKVNAGGTGLAYATFLGGSSGDGRYSGIAVDGAGNTYVTGPARSFDFPTTAGAFDISYNGGYSDAFVAKISIVEVTPTPIEITNSGFEGGFFGPVGQSVANGWAFYIAGGEPTFDGEYTTVHSGGWAQKVSGYARFAAGLAQALTVKPGASYRVTVYYQLYPPGDGQAFLGVQDGTAPAQWVGGGEGGVWRLLSQTLTVTSDQLIIYLHGHNGTGLNTNVYFDDVTVTELGQP